MGGTARLLRLVFALGLVVAEAACGFRPLYGRHGASGVAVAQLETVAIEPVDTVANRDRSGLLLQNTDRIGQQLRNHLYERMTPKGLPQHPRYTLEVQLSTRTDNLGIRKDASATRANLVVSAKIYLRTIDSDRKSYLFLETLRSVASYNLLDAQYATVTSQRDAEERATRQLADDITNRLATYFSQAQTPGSKKP
ncbi:MAG: LPS assembly lipoprotein LptE [Alphaproteobacteria bacterium]